MQTSIHIQQIKGNMIALAKSGDFDVIVHGCNCLGRMGAGLALQIAKAFPTISAFEKLRFQNAENNLRGASGHPVKGMCAGTISLDHIAYSEHSFHVVNLYTQVSMGKPSKMKSRQVYKDEKGDLRYKDIFRTDSRENRLLFIREACELLRDEFPEGKRIAFPRIGAGLACGNWEDIQQTILEVFAGYKGEITFIDYEMN